MLKKMMLQLIVVLFLSCSSLTYYSPKKVTSSIKFLNPTGDIYAYVDLSKNRFIYNALNFSYKIGLSTVGNLYLSYEKYENQFSMVVTGHFPKNAFFGINNDPGLQSMGNMLTNPKWKLKNADIYITPNRGRNIIVINQKEKLESNDNVLTREYIDEIEDNEMFFWFSSISKFLPPNIKKSLVPFDSGTLTLNSENTTEYNIKAVLKTDNARVLYLISRKLIPTLLDLVANIKIKGQLVAKELDLNTVVIKFKVEKENVKNLMSEMILKYTNPEIEDEEEAPILEPPTTYDNLNNDNATNDDIIDLE